MHTKIIGTVLALAAAGAIQVAHAQLKPMAPAAPASVAPAASAASSATAPTSPTTRAMEGAKPRGDIRPEKPVLPQVAVPLTRGEPNPVSTQSGKLVKPSGSVKDEAARCQAARSATSGNDCRSSNGK